MVNEQFSSIDKKLKINTIVFDVFGFSRGATAARHFCNEVSQRFKIDLERNTMPGVGVPIFTGKTYVSRHAGGLLGAMLHNAGHKPVGESYAIKIRFLGLFETVISDMVTKENLGYKIGLGGIIFPVLRAAPLLQESLPDIKTDLSEIRIGKVFHLRASTEWRKNFAFTPSQQGYTLSMLGAHSDIGGGYAELDKYEPVLGFFDVPKGDTTTLADMEKYRQFYIKEGICTEESLKFKNTYDHVDETTISIEGKDGTNFQTQAIRGDANFPAEGRTLSTDPYNQVYQTKQSDHYVLQDSRYICNKYALIPMYLMLEKAIEHKVPFFKNVKEAQDEKVKIEYPFEYELPDDEILHQYFELMKAVSKAENADKDDQYSISADMYNHICRNYIHLSAHFGGFESGLMKVRTGDHNPLEGVLFLNQPVEPTIKDGKVSYIRETYP